MGAGQRRGDERTNEQLPEQRVLWKLILLFTEKKKSAAISKLEDNLLTFHGGKCQ
jgi:hypothetical protein